MEDQQRGTLSHSIEEIKANLTQSGLLGASGATVEILVARDVPVTLDFTYYPGMAPIVSAAPEDCDEGCPPEVRFHSIRAERDVTFSGLHMRLTVDGSTDLTDFLDESDIEKLEEMIIKRAQQRI